MVDYEFNFSLRKSTIKQFEEISCSNYFEEHTTSVCAASC